MLIVSQEGDTIVNFANVSYLWIDEYDTAYEIRAYMAYHAISLGKYSTFYRALDILDNIKKRYSECNAFSSGFVKNEIYYLPKE